MNFRMTLRDNCEEGREALSRALKSMLDMLETNQQISSGVFYNKKGKPIGNFEIIDETRDST